MSREFSGSIFTNKTFEGYVGGRFQARGQEAGVLKSGNKVLSMRLDQGGPLTHGSPENFPLNAKSLAAELTNQGFRIVSATIDVMNPAF